MVQRNPAITLFSVGLQKSPLCCTGTIRFVHDGEDTLSGENTHDTVVCTRAPADVQVRDGDSDTVRFELSLHFRAVHHIPVCVKYRCARVAVSAPLCVFENSKSPNLTLGVVPAYSYTVEDGFCGRTGGLYGIVLGKIIPLNEITELVHI